MIWQCTARTRCICIPCPPQKAPKAIKWSTEGCTNGTDRVQEPWNWVFSKTNKHESSVCMYTILAFLFSIVVNLSWCLVASDFPSLYSFSINPQKEAKTNPQFFFCFVEKKGSQPVRSELLPEKPGYFLVALHKCTHTKNKFLFFNCVSSPPTNCVIEHHSKLVLTLEPFD